MNAQWPTMTEAYIFVIGLGMFLCPIVPGSAVYLFVACLQHRKSAEKSSHTLHQ